MSSILEMLTGVKFVSKNVRAAALSSAPAARRRRHTSTKAGYTGRVSRDDFADPTTARQHLLRAALQSANVPIVDGHAIALHAKETEKWLPFGRDGAHWNDIGQFYSVKRLVGELERQLGTPIGDIRLRDVQVDDSPRGADGDAGLIAVGAVLTSSCTAGKTTYEPIIT